MFWILEQINDLDGPNNDLIGIHVHQTQAKGWLAIFNLVVLVVVVVVVVVAIVVGNGARSVS